MHTSNIICAHEHSVDAHATCTSMLLQPVLFKNTHTHYRTHSPFSVKQSAWLHSLWKQHVDKAFTCCERIHLGIQSYYSCCFTCQIVSYLALLIGKWSEENAHSSCLAQLTVSSDDIVRISRRAQLRAVHVGICVMFALTSRHCPMFCCVNTMCKENACTHNWREKKKCSYIFVCHYAFRVLWFAVKFRFFVCECLYHNESSSQLPARPPDSSFEYLSTAKQRQPYNILAECFVKLCFLCIIDVFLFNRGWCSETVNLVVAVMIVAELSTWSTNLLWIVAICAHHTL